MLFVPDFLMSYTGDHGLTELSLRTTKTLPSSDWGLAIKKSNATEWEGKFHVYFPSLRTVKSSKGGSQGAGTICFQSKWYDRPNFPKHVMRDCASRREGLLMHNKVDLYCYSVLLYLQFQPWIIS